jgi:phage repressor protein C with HTH and peptisase S24 domain
MKLKYSHVRDTLQNLIEYVPTHAELADEFKLHHIDTTANALSNRLSNDGYLKENEIKVIEEAFSVSLLPNDNKASDNCVDLDYFSDVWASCGTGAVVFEETSEKLSVPTSLIQNYSKTNRYSVINSRGDSMTPFIQDRDKLIVEHWNGGQIIDNCIYVFRYANELFVKRLVKNITQIVIKSDNPLYEPIKITDKDQDFEVIGQIVGLMRDLR